MVLREMILVSKPSRSVWLRGDNGCRVVQRQSCVMLISLVAWSASNLMLSWSVERFASIRVVKRI